MEGYLLRHNTEESKMKKFNAFRVKRLNERGIALVMALIIGLVVFGIVTGLIYFIIQSVSISGAGKRYTTASEAADGAIEVMKDGIHLVFFGEPVPGIINDNNGCLINAVLTDNQTCQNISLTLPGPDLSTDFTAIVTVERLYSSTLPGARVEFARAGGGVPTTGVYYRLGAVVTGPGGTRAESSALYRYTM